MPGKDTHGFSVDTNAKVVVVVIVVEVCDGNWFHGHNVTAWLTDNASTQDLLTGIHYDHAYE